MFHRVVAAIPSDPAVTVFAVVDINLNKITFHQPRKHLVNCGHRIFLLQLHPLREKLISYFSRRKNSGWGCTENLAYRLRNTSAWPNPRALSQWQEALYSALKSGNLICDRVSLFVKKAETFPSLIDPRFVIKGSHE